MAVVQDLVGIWEQEQERGGRSRSEGLGPVAPSWRHTRLRSPVPSTAHQLLSRPQLPLSYFPETRRTSEGTDSPGVKKHCDSVIKADQWLRQAHFSRRRASFRDCFMFTFTAGSGSGWDLNLGCLPPWLVIPPSTNTALPDRRLSLSEKESHPAWSPSGTALQSPRACGSSRVWLLKPL